MSSTPLTHCCHRPGVYWCQPESRSAARSQLREANAELREHLAAKTAGGGNGMEWGEGWLSKNQELFWFGGWTGWFGALKTQMIEITAEPSLP